MLKRKGETDVSQKSKKSKKSLKSDDNKNSNNDDSKIKKAKYEKPLGKKFDKENVSKSGEQLEKPNWTEIKKKSKQLKEKYKAKKLHNIYDITMEVKKISEKLRRFDCNQQDRKNLVSEAHNLLQTHYNKVIFTHDMSRIIQWIIKYGESNVQQAILNEIKPSLSIMFASKYAKNCIKNLLKHGSAEMKSDIISACYGNVVKFISHLVSAPLMELLYKKWATETQKVHFKQEFYGDMYKQAKDSNIKTLTDVFKTSEDMKSATLSAVKGNLNRILNKKLIHYTLVQSVLLEFLNECSPEDRAEMIVALRSSIAELSDTKTGTQIAMICIWHSTNKDRKLIMKALKENARTVAMSEHGYLILLALFDTVDDTVLVKKIILSEIQKDLTEIALNEYGKHVILYLVARRNSHYFPPKLVKYLQQGDNNEASKKPADVREKENRDSIIDSLLDAVTADAATWMSNSSVAMVTLAILKVGTGKKLNNAFESVAKFLINSKSKIKEEDVEYKPIEHAGLHMVLKKLIQNDKELQKKDELTFGSILYKHLDADIIENWIECNRGCFLLVFLLENEPISIVNSLHLKLKPVMKNVKLNFSPGATILLKKLSEKAAD